MSTNGVNATLMDGAGMLADKFNQYKLFLVGSVALTGLFHSLLLQVDAGSLMGNGNVASNESAQWICNRTGSWLSFPTHQPCNGLIRKVNVTWDLSDCQNSCPESLDLNLTALQSDWLIQTFTSQSECLAPIELNSNFKCNCPANCSVAVMQQWTTAEFKDLDEFRRAELAKHNRGFWIYFVVRILASMALNTSLSMLNATAICMVQTHKGDLGKQRICGVIAQSIFGMVGGVLLDWTESLTGYPDYSSVFYLADTLLLVALMVALTRLDVAVEQVQGNFGANFKKLIRLADVNVFLVMMLFLGASWGLYESYLFVYLTEMNASSYLLAMTVSFSCIFGIPFLYVSDCWVRFFGKINMIIAAFVVYCFRFVGYSLIWNPWYCLLLETCEAVTVHLMGVASSMFCASAAPPGTLATLNGAVGSFHYSFGRGLGSFVGGILISQYGTRTTFQVFGIASGILGLFYLALHRIWLVRLERERTKSDSAADQHESQPMKKKKRRVSIKVEHHQETSNMRPDALTERRMSCI